MFDLDGESLWMGPKVSPRKPSARKFTKATRKTFVRKKGFAAAKRDFSKAKPFSVVETITKGYSGSAKQEYLRRERAFQKAREEKQYKDKLRSEFGVKSVSEKFKGFFKPKKKSIYK